MYPPYDLLNLLVSSENRLCCISEFVFTIVDATFPFSPRSTAKRYEWRRVYQQHSRETSVFHYGGIRKYSAARSVPYRLIGIRESGQNVAICCGEVNRERTTRKQKGENGKNNGRYSMFCLCSSCTPFPRKACITLELIISLFLSEGASL